MSVDKPNDTIKIWEGAIEFAAPVHDAGTEDFKTRIEKLLVQFGSHKETLLSRLRNACDGDAKAESFDADGSWLAIEGLARHYYVQELVKREAISNADREAQCRKIAETRQQSMTQGSGPSSPPSQGGVGRRH